MILNDTANRLLTREATSKGLGSKATSHSILNDQVAVGCQPFWADPMRHSDLRTHTETWSDGLIPRQFAPSSPSKKRCLPCRWLDVGGTSCAKTPSLWTCQAHQPCHTGTCDQLAGALHVASAAAMRPAKHIACTMSIVNNQIEIQSNIRETHAGHAEATTILQLCDACRPLCLCKNPQSACAIKVTFWQSLQTVKALFSRPWAKPIGKQNRIRMYSIRI